MPSAFLLVSHGSRDPRPELAMQQLVRYIAQMRSQPQLAAVHPYNDVFPQQPLVDQAALELNPLPLHQQIIEFGDRAIAYGCDRVQIVPLFLLAGTHVIVDIPEQVAIAQQTLKNKLALDLQPHLGTHPGLVPLLRTALATTDMTAKREDASRPSADVDAWILLSHGSRRAKAKETVQAIAAQLGIVDAYWAIPPSLESRVKTLVDAGYQQIGILPYFLFAGGITDAIAQAVAQLQTQFPRINLHLAEPIGASPKLADLICDLVE